MGAKSQSASQPGLLKPPSTPEMSAHDAEAMVDSMLRDSPLLNQERVTEEIPEDDGGNKLPEGSEGEKRPEGGHGRQPTETPTGKLAMPCRKGTFLFSLSVIK